MNTFDLSKAWFDWSFENPDKISPSHTAIYFFAIDHCNRLGWKQKFGMPTQMVMDAVGIKKHRTYQKYLNDLIDWGFLELVQKSTNQWTATIISIPCAMPKKDKAMAKAIAMHLQGMGQSKQPPNGHLNKPNNNKLKNNKTKNVYDETVHECFENCLIYFSDHLHPNTLAKKNNWLDTIEKLNRIDKIPFEIIEQIVEHIRNDEFWSKNFLSMAKLRKTNKDGVKYIVAFYEQLKSKNNGKINPKATKSIRDQYGNI